MIQLFGKVLVEKAAELIVVDYMGRSDMANIQSLRRDWQGLSCKASDIEEEVHREEMSGKKKRKREVDSWLKEVKKLSPEIDALETRGSSWRLPLREDPVGKLQLQVKELVDESRHFGGLVLDNYDNIGEPCLPTKLFGVKFEEAKQRIWPCLVTDNISSIGIYGMGGVGKTTLAKDIKYHLSVNTNYEVLWVTVSQEFSITNLQDKIANVLRIHRLSSRDEEEVRADISRGAFSKKKRLVVLILDDVWEEFCLDRVGIPLHARNCRLILTTRSLEVCNRMQCQRKFGLKTLDTNEAWDLFKYKLGSETLLLGELEGIAKSIVKECDGLPLAIITVAGSMRAVTDTCEWKNALEQLKACSIGFDEMEKKVFPILEWSFNRLNECQRNCFLYCSLYREDSEIEKKELIDLFIGAELMPKRESWSQEFGQGHAILNKLIKVCLLEETRGYGEDDCVKMHDLVRDMALRITDGKSSLQMNGDVPRFLVKSIGKGNSKATLEQGEWTEDLHAVSFCAGMFQGVKIEVPPAWSPNCSKLSTLLLSWVSIREIPDSFFWHMCGLKVLNLNCCGGITELPNCVSDMVNLTALILGGCVDLRSVPPLGKLKQLRDLDLSSTEIEDFPEGWESLVNLERLNLDGCGSLSQTKIPKGTFSQLHRLLLPLYGSVQVNDPELLNQLEVFRGYLSFMDFCKITRWPKYYNIYINDILTEDQFYDIDDCADQKQLYFLQCQFGIGSNDLPDDMKHLLIEECEGMGIRCLSDVFKNFINLSHLYELAIQDLVGTEFLWQLSIASPRDQLEVSSFSPLRDLQVLLLHRLSDLVGLFCGESEPYLLPAGIFPSLKELWISECHSMKQLFTVQLLQNLQNLEALYVEDCEGLEEIAADGNGEGQGGGEGIQLTSSGGGTTMISLPNLRCLSLDMLPQLNNICKAAMICDSIEKIKIFNCPNLKRLPSFLPTINGPPYLLPAGTFSSLKKLSISGCHNMKQLFTVQLLQNLQNLEMLGVGDCRGLEEIAADGNRAGQGGGEGIQLTSSEGATATVTLPKLRRLNLTELPQLKNVCKAAMICDSIEEIAIFNCPKVKRLPLFLSTIGGPPSIPRTLYKIRGDKEWWESLEWDYPSAKNDLDPYFTTKWQDI